MSAIAFALLDDNEVVDSARAAGLQGTVEELYLTALSVNSNGINDMSRYCPFCVARARLENLCR